MTTPVTLGQKVRDRVSGYTGYAVSRHILANGCIQIGIQPSVSADKLNDLPDPYCFDQSQLEFVDAGLSELTQPVKETVVLKFGEEAFNEVAGCKGIVMERIEHMNGCVFYCTQGKAKKDGVPPKAITAPAWSFKKTGVGLSKLVAKMSNPDPATPRKEPPGGPSRLIERM